MLASAIEYGLDGLRKVIVCVCVHVFMCVYAHWLWTTGMCPCVYACICVLCVLHVCNGEQNIFSI